MMIRRIKIWNLIILCIWITTFQEAAAQQITSHFVEPGKAQPPVYLGEPPANEGTSLLREKDGSINFIFRKGDWDHGGFSDELFSMVTKDEGKTWSEPVIIGNTGEAAQSFSTISPVTDEIISFFIRRDRSVKGNYRFVRSSNGRTDWEYNYLFDTLRFGGMGYGNCLWIDLPDGTKRVIAGAHQGNIGARSYYSDDDGKTWGRSEPVFVPNLIPNIWHTGAVEPSFLQLNDGRIWMLIRNSNDRLWESFSSDNGETWSEAVPTRFKCGPNSWVSTLRLSTGEILVVWNNAMSMHPSATQDIWSFTNRDLIHGAISPDEGESWYGFREIWKDAMRDSTGFVNHPGDKGINESKLAETTEGNVLIACGQAPGHRAFVLLDPKWLYENEAEDDFSTGLDQWSTHKLLVRSPVYSRLYHYNYNRKPGPALVTHPDDPNKHVLHIRKVADSTVYSQRDGAVWNFPAGSSGSFYAKIRLNKGFRGATISLNDRWYQPSDSQGEESAMFQLEIPGSGKLGKDKILEMDHWYEVELKWGETSRKSGWCKVLIDGEEVSNLPLRFESENGLSYVRFKSGAIWPDDAGMYVEYVKAQVK
jgi:hypothetical protein